MTLLPYLVFAALALGAIGFVIVPLLRTAEPGRRLANPRARLVLALAAGLFLLGVGGGTYIIVGQPKLALRGDRPSDTDINGLIGLLIKRVHQYPNDAVAWNYLGRGYLAARDPADAVRAFGRAIEVTRGPVEAGLYSAYGEAMVEDAGGSIPPQAEVAFTRALAADPHDTASRFFLGQARAMHGDREGARQIWTALLADTPPQSPLHQILIDRVALLTGASGASPNIMVMVEGLAARLKADPHDAAGWQRLIRAYAVLGDADKAKSALATARATFAGQSQALAPINDEAKSLKLD